MDGDGDGWPRLFGDGDAVMGLNASTAPYVARAAGSQEQAVHAVAVEALSLSDQCRAWAAFPEAMLPMLSDQMPLTLRERLLLRSTLESVADQIEIQPQGTMRDIERQAIIAALRVHPTQKAAAEALGITDRVINFKMRALGIPRKSDHRAA